MSVQDKPKRSSFKILGMEFAPVVIPLERRIQTLAVLFWIATFLFLGTLTLTIMTMLMFTQWKWIPILYVTWLVYDWNTPFTGGRKNTSVRDWTVWKYYKKFFPINLVKTVDLSPDKTYLFGSHPHGILCSGAFCCFGTEAAGFSKIFPGLTARLLTLKGQFMIPGYRDLFLSTGACAATKEGMEALLEEPKGTAAVLVPGGALEAINSDPDKIRLVLNRRKGFIKLALRYGVDLVPTFSFGEAFVYDQVKSEKGGWLWAFQTLAEKWVGFVPVIFLGRGIFQYNFGLLPKRQKISVVVGKPLEVVKTLDPTRDQIAELHEKYVKALTDLYNDYNPIYGDTNVSLVIE